VTDLPLMAARCERSTCPPRARFAAFAAFALAVLGMTVLPAAAAANHEHAKVYVFVLDGLDGDELEIGSAPFISSLMAGEAGATSTYYPNSRSVMVAETNPNHTAMITGAYPVSSGITGNEFAVYGQPRDEDSCPGGAPDESLPPAPTSGESTGCVEVPNLFETVERRRNPEHLSTALIMGKPKLARLFSSKQVSDARYDADYVWAPCDDDEPYCEDVPTNPITGYTLDDTIVMDEVIRTTREGVLDRGKQRRPDFTFANFPQIDSAGHATGRSSAYMTAIAIADGEIERFVANQKELGIWDRTVMMIVSDHSMDDTPQLNKVSLADALEAGGIEPAKYTIVGNGSAAHIYLTDRRAADANATLKEMRGVLTGIAGIDEVIYRQPNPADGGDAHSLAAEHPEWGLGGSRTGDLVVTTEPAIGIRDTSEVNSFPFNPLPGNHGAPHTADNAFLITGGSPVLRQGSDQARAVNVDVNPTAMKLLSRKPAKTAEGEFRREAFKVKMLKRNRKGGKGKR
jgi:hypothetical protein